MIVRRQESLEELMGQIEAFRQEVPLRSTATDNFLLTSEMILRSALLRKESRGTHYREDFPESHIDYEKPSLVRRDKQGRMTVSLK